MDTDQTPKKTAVESPAGRWLAMSVLEVAQRLECGDGAIAESPLSPDPGVALAPGAERSHSGDAPGSPQSKTWRATADPAPDPVPQTFRCSCSGSPSL